MHKILFTPKGLQCTNQFFSQNYVKNKQEIFVNKRKTNKEIRFQIEIISVYHKTGGFNIIYMYNI